MENKSRHEMIASLLSLDIEVFAKAYPDNEELLALKRQHDLMLEDDEYLKKRYSAVFVIWNEKRRAEYLEKNPGSVR